MKQGNDLIHQAVQELENSSTTSATAAGQVDRDTLIDTINQVFTLFRLNYHNQYYSAYPDTEQLNQNKKLWLDSLSKYAPEQILRAAKVAIEECEYLPNLHRMNELCRAQGPGKGLPSARDAYQEACNAPSPKAAYAWSHPAVYHAALDSGWYLLANEIESKAFPVFEKKYREVCNRVLAGEELIVEPPALLEEKPSTPLPKSESKKKLADIKKLLD
ncbi:replication protein P [Porticoccaceae bacterium LTM1]|nr:replication protein P [Porticoccaceae bacterium LTM1]